MKSLPLFNQNTCLMEEAQIREEVKTPIRQKTCIASGTMPSQKKVSEFN